MRTNFYPIRNFDAASGAGLAALGAAGPVGLGLGAAQTALGLGQAIVQGARANRLRKRRKAYQTPEEIFKIAEAATSRAAGGYDPETLAYLTGETDRGFSSAIRAATQYGADPNALSDILDRRIQSTFAIGEGNQRQNMLNYAGYREALGLVAENKAAEQKSQQDIIKDDLQAASAGQQAGLQNILGGANTALNTLTSANIANLYRTPPTATPSYRSNPTVPLAETPGVSPVGGQLLERSSFPDLSGVNLSQSKMITPEPYRQYIDLLNQANKIKIGQ